MLQFILNNIFQQACYQAANATSVPPSAILAGLLILCSFVLSPAVVKVPNTDWEEPTLLWLIVNMPTGSRKTTVYQFLRNILEGIRDLCGCTSKYALIILGCYS